MRHFCFTNFTGILGHHRLINKFQRGHKSWMEVFETDKKEEVEKRCRENNIAYQWHQNGWLEICRMRPAVIQHPLTEETVWFNQAHLFDFSPRFLGFWRYLGTKLFYLRKHTKLSDVFFADGSKIPRKDLNHIHDVLDQHAIYFPWKKGDLLVLDNILAMHARAPFSGPRRILTAMTK